MKKIFLGLGSIIVIATPVIAAVSCGEKELNKKGNLVGWEVKATCDGVSETIFYSSASQTESNPRENNKFVFRKEQWQSMSNGSYLDFSWDEVMVIKSANLNDSHGKTHTVTFESKEVR